jgi:hypothetical protein
MKKLAEKGGLLWIVFLIIPIAAFTEIIGKAINLDSSIILGIQLPTLSLQLFSLFMLIRYWRVIF